MKVRVEFGPFSDSEDITWYRPIGDFPKLLRYRGDIYEFVMYKAENNRPYDYIFHMAQTNTYNISYNDIPSFNELFRFPLDNTCQCGAKYDRDSPNSHMFFCPKWKPKGVK